MSKPRIVHPVPPTAPDTERVLDSYRYRCITCDGYGVAGRHVCDTCNGTGYRAPLTTVETLNKRAPRCADMGFPRFHRD